MRFALDDPYAVVAVAARQRMLDSLPASEGWQFAPVSCRGCPDTGTVKVRQLAGDEPAGSFMLNGRNITFPAATSAVFACAACGAAWW